jgi:hypothetical protein
MNTLQIIISKKAIEEHPLSRADNYGIKYFNQFHIPNSECVKESHFVFYKHLRKVYVLWIFESRKNRGLFQKK